MSYSKRYTTNIPYSGTVTYRYPASEHGGTGVAEYSGGVPVGVTIDVQTDSFDQSVDQTNASLAVVATALTAAEAAQVAEIRRAGERISQTAIRGFFGMLSAEMSSKASEFGSSMKSSTGLLVEEARQVEHVHEQMASDYQAIKARYLRIFRELDRELDRRIRELDQPAFDLGKRRMPDVERPFEESAARAIAHTDDLGITQLKLQCARAKRRASESVKVLGEMCGHIREYGHAVDGMLEDGGDEGYVFEPVVVSVQQDLDMRGEQRICVHDRRGSSDASGGASPLQSGVIPRFSQVPQAQWRSTEEDRAEVDRRFMREVGRYGRDAQSDGDASANEARTRVAQLIARLYGQPSGGEQGMESGGR